MATKFNFRIIQETGEEIIIRRDGNFHEVINRIPASEIERQAKEFIDKWIGPDPIVHCLKCRGSNCPHNDSCIKCNYKFFHWRS